MGSNSQTIKAISDVTFTPPLGKHVLTALTKQQVDEPNNCVAHVTVGSNGQKNYMRQTLVSRILGEHHTAQKKHVLKFLTKQQVY